MEVIKGKALRQDLNLYDGVNSTGQRKSSSGGYVDGLLIGDEVDVISVHGQGRNRTQTVIQNCVNSLGSLNRSIKFAPGTWTIESNTTIPANITSIIPAGVVFNISTGITLTFSGPYRCDSQNLKTGSGTLTFTDEKMLQSVAGTNTITASVLSTLTVLANGQEFLLVPANSITAAATLNINSTGAVNLRKNQSGGVVALVANDLIANNLYRLVYNSAGPYFMVNNVSSYAQGADVASATTINLDTATGDYVHVTGTTTITGVTLKQGQERTIVFDGALTFTNGASLLLPGSADITTAANDTAILRGEASGVVRCINYTPKLSGLTAVSGFVSGGRRYIVSDGSSATAFDVDSNITATTFESVGPTGSLATNIWTAMDAIPAGARIATIRFSMSWDPTAADTPAGITLCARATGGSTAMGALTTIFQHELTPDDDVAGNDEVLSVTRDVPLDASRRVDLTWTDINISARSIAAYLVGFIF